VRNSWWWTENCPKRVEFYSKNKFEKLVNLVGFIIRIYHAARSAERQNCSAGLIVLLKIQKTGVEVRLHPQFASATSGVRWWPSLCDRSFTGFRVRVTLWMGCRDGLDILETRDFVFMDFCQDIIAEVQSRLSDTPSNFLCQFLTSKLIYTLLYVSSSAPHFTSLAAEFCCLSPSDRTLNIFACLPYYYFAFYTHSQFNRIAHISEPHSYIYLWS